MTVVAKKYKENSSHFIKNSLGTELSDHNAKIAKLAHYRAEKRKFALGYELKDWFDEDREYLS